MSFARRPELLILALGAVGAACRDDHACQPKPAACIPTLLAAKRGTPALDGKLDQPVWHAAQATAPFVDERRNAPVPHTEARASWDDDSLFGVLYVADDELQATDGVWLDFAGGRSIEASPDRKLVCRFGAQSDCAALGIKAGFDVLASIVGTDDGSRRLGEVALGMNPGLTRALKHPLFVEKVGGTLHIAIGASYEDSYVEDPRSEEGAAPIKELERSGALNRSAQHVDIVTDFRPGGCGRRVRLGDVELKAANGVWVVAP